MTEYSLEALGAVVKELRKAQGDTQAELGEKAGYAAGTGAGVSMSRLEGGLLEPGDERLALLAGALGLTLEQLKAKAAKRTHEEATKALSAPSSSGALHADPTLTAKEIATRRAKQPRERLESVQAELLDRMRVVQQLSEQYAAAHDRARDEFLMRFVDLVGRLEGAPPPRTAELDLSGGAAAEAALEVAITSQGVAQALALMTPRTAASAKKSADDFDIDAYELFVQRVAVGAGTALSSSALAELSSPSTMRTINRVLGRRSPVYRSAGVGAAGAVLPVVGLVVVPLAIAVAGTLVARAKRNRKEQEELAARLAEAEAELSVTQPGFDAVLVLLPRATETLEYIALHAGHALTRWEAALGDRATWRSLGDDAQQRYQDFVDVAGAQLSLANIDFEALAAANGTDRDGLIERAEGVLARAERVVKAHV